MIVVALHEPQDLVNIAHVVRAMKNFGLDELRLVSPREYDTFRIGGIAHQTHDILARVRVFDTLEAAIGDCVHVLGFTARGRSAKRNVQRPREAAREALGLADSGPVALLFGREDKGLTNEALDRCHRVVTIPSRPEYPSLNLAHAVVVMLYELSLARDAPAGDHAIEFKPPRRKAGPAQARDLERLFEDIARGLTAIDFFKTRDAEHVLRSLREIIHRTPIDAREVKLLRAMAIEVVKYSDRLARSGIHVDR
ncbi:MAG TPA: RNA methyltransferase [Gemmatimonadales bacterium]|nr:RNA methyltransferase [Gemmatimonadales bacterium]